MTDQNAICPSLRPVLCIDARPAIRAALFRQTDCNFAAMPRLVLPSPSAGHTGIDPAFWTRFAQLAGLEMPSVAAVAVPDDLMRHWHALLRRHAEHGAPPEAFMLPETDAGRLRAAGLAELHNAARIFVTGSGLAALLWLLHNPEIHERSFRRGLVLLNAGETHVTAFLVWRGRVFGVYEQRVSGPDVSGIRRDLAEFRLGWLPDEAVRNAGGYGTAFADIPPEAEGFPATYITGPESGLFDGYGKIHHSPEADVFAGCLGMGLAIDAVAIDAMAGNE